MLHEPAHVLAGNKRFKLEQNLDLAVEQGLTGIVSFGGAWSNHVAALAFAAEQRGLRSVCIIRGEAAYLSNPTLSEAQRRGMQFEFVDRAQYRQRHDQEWLVSLSRRYPNYLILPEGGSNRLAVESCRGILDSLAATVRNSFNVIACPVGTGATLTGLCLGLAHHQQARGYMAVHDPNTLARIQQWWSELGKPRPAAPIKLIDASAPGYASLDAEHYRCVSHWFESTGILLDPVYTIKMLSSVGSELGIGAFSPGARVLLIHTGGYQGWRGWLDGARQRSLTGQVSAPTLHEISRVQCQVST